MYYLADFKTQQRIEPTDFVFTGENGPWEVHMDLDQVRRKINTEYFRKSPPFVSKYLPFMPIRDYNRFVSLGEGATPLIRSNAIEHQLDIELYFKLENQNPTGSFKDRGSAVEVTVAGELGAKGIAVASTGNMAASCSCYAAAAHIPCFVFAPEDTPPSKLAQVISYGGRIVQVKGSYGDAARLAEQTARQLNFYLAGDYAYRIEGHKTAAFELIEQLFYRPPNLVVIPMGCGTNLASYYKGFCEYKEMGFIGRIPRLLGVQSEGAPTIVSAFEQKLSDSISFDKVESIARAICINHALDGAKALDSLYRTDGDALALSDQEMLEAQYMLSKDEGLFIETSSAATLAALIRLQRQGKLEKGSRVVCVLTGAGLKDPTPILKIAIKPPTIQPNVEEFIRLYDQKFFDGRNVTFVDKDEIVFAEVPNLDQVKTRTFELFGIDYSETHIARIQEIINRFLKKGKVVTFADLQDIVQDAMETLSDPSQRVLSVEDFEVSTGKDRKSTAKITVRVGSDQVQTTGEGVGPVDAVINALKSASGGRMQFSLASYYVATRSQGTNAVVFVELKLSNDQHISLGTGTSPDIIQASIEAFEDAYNELSRTA